LKLLAWLGRLPPERRITLEIDAVRDLVHAASARRCRARPIAKPAAGHSIVDE
jgi:hypothetical protein